MNQTPRIPQWILDQGPFSRTSLAQVSKTARHGSGKVSPDLDTTLAKLGLRDGATLSFHHHLRNGDAVMVAVIDACARAGLRDLHVAASSIFPAQARTAARLARDRALLAGSNLVSIRSATWSRAFSPSPVPGTPVGRMVVTLIRPGTPGAAIRRAR